jgi:hypothetical protein
LRDVEGDGGKPGGLGEEGAAVVEEIGGKSDGAFDLAFDRAGGGKKVAHERLLKGCEAGGVVFGEGAVAVMEEIEDDVEAAGPYFIAVTGGATLDVMVDEVEALGDELFVGGELRELRPERKVRGGFGYRGDGRGDGGEGKATDTGDGASGHEGRRHEAFSP